MIPFSRVEVSKRNKCDKIKLKNERRIKGVHLHIKLTMGI
jgi:hypothetical protein